MKPIFKATSTPLSSIFGSGFLIIVPILAGAVGSYSVLAMAVVCALAYAVGAVIRYNIINAEPVLAGTPPEHTQSLERSSDLALVLAYVISVCLYLHILSSFVLGGFDADTELNENIVTTVIVLAIVLVGITKGLDVLDSLEQWGLYITLAIIALLLFAFLKYDLGVWQTGAGFTMPKAMAHTKWEVLTIVAGTLIVVQGFETTRYLGKMYDTETRVKASRLSQIVSTVVYLGFVAAALPAVHTLNGNYDDNSLVALVKVVAAGLVIPLIIAAALSQFSAAVADTLAATGNMQETTHGHITTKWGCILVGAGAIALSWNASTIELVAFASRAFAFFYFLQCLVAISVSKNGKQKVGMIAVAAAMAFIAVFAVPAG